MNTNANVAAALNAIGITTSMAKTKIRKLSPRQRSIRQAAPLYFTEAQCEALIKAGEDGWQGRSVVTNTKSHHCAVSLESDDSIIWVSPEGSVKGEEWLVRDTLA